MASVYLCTVETFFPTGKNHFFLLQCSFSRFKYINSKIIKLQKRKKKKKIPLLLASKRSNMCVTAVARELSGSTMRSCLWKEKGQWRDRRQDACERRKWWRDGLSDRRRWQQTSGAEKLWSGPNDYLTWYLSTFCFFLLFCMFCLHYLWLLTNNAWISWINPPLRWLFFSLLSLILWGLFCTEAQ